ncbi:MAG: hypothetical protein IJZ57_07875 [Clostridia bacterium]|nr:hypothetical protein [Clostridia bacterium]
MGFFTDIFNGLNDEEKESFYQTVIMNDPSDYAAKARVEYYKTKLKFMGENVKIGAGVKIVNPEFVSLGNDVEIKDGCTLHARGEGGITLGDNVRVQERVYLDTERVATGYIKVGRGSYIGTGTTLFGHVGLEIGEDCLLAQNITLTPYSHIYDDPERIIYSQGGHCEKVTIGNDCYLGMGVCVMYSGNIGQGSVIGAGSTVVKPIPPYSIAVGSPARVIKNRK